MSKTEEKVESDQTPNEQDNLELIERRMADEIAMRVEKHFKSKYGVIGVILISMALGLLTAAYLGMKDAMADLFDDAFKNEIMDAKVYKKVAKDHLNNVHMLINDSKEAIMKAQIALSLSKKLDSAIEMVDSILLYTFRNYHNNIETMKVTKIARNAQMEYINEELEDFNSRIEELIKADDHLKGKYTELVENEENIEATAHSKFHAIVTKFPILIAPDIENLDKIMKALRMDHFSIDTLGYRYKTTKPMGIRLQSDITIDIAQRILRVVQKFDKNLTYVYLGNVSTADVDNTFIGTRGETDNEDKIPFNKINFNEILEKGISEERFHQILKKSIKN